jgi:hypothetical protein
VDCLTLLFPHPILCSVITNLGTWCAWLVAVPLLTYSVLVSEFGKAPSTVDLVAIVSHALMIQSGLAMQFHISYGLTWFFFLLSSILLLVGLAAIYLSNATSAKELAEAKQSSLITKNFQSLSFTITMKKDMSLLYGVMLVIFAIVYSAAAVGLLTPNMTLVTYLFLDVVSKGLVPLVVLDAHLVLLQVVESDLSREREINQRRRTLMRLMFQ